MCGGNRRSREERQGRNEFGCGNPNLGQPREDAHGDIGGGAIFEELQERNPRPSVGFGRSVSEGSERNRMAFEGEASGGSEREWRKLLRIDAGRGEKDLDTGRANHPRTSMPCDVKTPQHET